MTPDQEHDIYTKGFDAGQTHSKSSPETIERFNELEKANIRIEGKIDRVLDNQNRMDNFMSKIEEQVNTNTRFIDANKKTIIEKVPKLEADVSDNKTKIKIGIAVISVIQILIGLGMITFK